jgi:hypothetical protein
MGLAGPTNTEVMGSNPIRIMIYLFFFCLFVVLRRWSLATGLIIVQRNPPLNFETRKSGTFDQLASLCRPRRP